MTQRSSQATPDRIEGYLAADDPQMALVLIARAIMDASPEGRRELLDLQARAYVTMARRSMAIAHGELSDADEKAAAELFEQALELCRGQELELDLDPSDEFDRLLEGRTPNKLERIKLRQILQSLDACDFVQSAAADRLGISKFQMHRDLRRFGLLDEVRDRRAARLADEG